MASKICKIVYFDEDSVTDYVQIVAGGTLEKTTELLNSSDLSEEQKADVSAKGGIGGVFKALLGWEASASGEVSAGLALNRNKMVKNIVKNALEEKPGCFNQLRRRQNGISKIQGVYM